MKSTVFARPNLKAFLLGAILIAIVQNFIANGHSQATVVRARTLPASELSANQDLAQLLAMAKSAPDAELYLRISRCYERQGDMRRALQYFRRSQILSQAEEADD